MNQTRDVLPILQTSVVVTKTEYLLNSRPALTFVTPRGHPAHLTNLVTAHTCHTVAPPASPTVWTRAATGDVPPSTDTH